MSFLKRLVRRAPANSGQNPCEAAATRIAGLLGAHSSGTTVTGEQLVEVLQLLLVIPPSHDGDVLLSGDFSRLLAEVAATPHSKGIVHKHASLLSELIVGPGQKELSDALADVLRALAPDACLEQHKAAAAESAETAAMAKAGSGQGDNVKVLAAACQQASALSEARARCGEILRSHRFSLHQAEMLVGGFRRSAEQRAIESFGHRTKLEEERALANERFQKDISGLLWEEGSSLEAEVATLERRAGELRQELDIVSQQLDACQQRQRAFMAQSDARHADMEQAQTAKAGSQLELAAQAETVQLQRAACLDLSDAVQGIRIELGSAATPLGGYEADAAELRHAEQELSRIMSESQAGAQSHLEAAAATAKRWHTEHLRAVETLELLSVEGAEVELPTRRELPMIQGKLQQAWQARDALGSVDDACRSEIGELLATLAALDPARSVADTPNAVQQTASPPVQEPEFQSTAVPVVCGDFGREVPSDDASIVPPIV